MEICLILKKEKNQNKKIINLLNKNKKIKIDIYFSKVGTSVPEKLKKKKISFYHLIFICLGFK